VQPYQYPSILLEKSVQELSKLPGIGQKTAFRLIMHLLRQGDMQMSELADALKKLSENVHYCKRCHSISDDDLCDICRNSNRNQTLLCVVEDVNDMMAIEKTNQYNGLYHVLGGLISPMDGISPSQLTISSLEERLKQESFNEIIFALSATVEGDTTAYYIYKRLKEYPVSFTTIAKGVAVGNELEYTDEITLARSIVHRLAFDNSIK
jgi:recombination protein RecR